MTKRKPSKNSQNLMSTIKVKIPKVFVSYFGNWCPSIFYFQRSRKKKWDANIDNGHDDDYDDEEKNN